MRIIIPFFVLMLMLGSSQGVLAQDSDVPKVRYEDSVKLRFDRNPFPDTNIKSISGKAAAELNRRGVLGGFPDGEFKGKLTVNRAEAAKILLSSRDIVVDLEPTENPFEDVIMEEWYAPYVLKAAELGIIKGNPDGTFRPTDKVLTAEFMKMLAETFDLETDLPYDYDDEADYPGAWFWSYAGVAQRYNIFPHRPSSLRPEVPMTRNEVAVAIYSYLKNRKRYSFQ